MAIKKIEPIVEVQPAEEKKTTELVLVTKKVKTPQLLRGFHDVLGEDQIYWDAIHRKVRELAYAYSFDRIELPILEPVELFVRSVGKQTDIVEKEMFQFQDQSGANVVMRPEATASTARAYIEHGMVDRPQPVKMFYDGPMFRYDRPQAGRYRQFHQFGFEAFGSDEAIIDAQLILIAERFFRELGIPVAVQVNSIGTTETRAEYKVELATYYRQHRNVICEDCKRRLTRNPMRVLDCKEDGCRAVSVNAPQIIDWLDEPSKEHFMRVLEYLDEVEVHYQLAPHLVRGLDYYTRTVFEIVPEVADDKSTADSSTADELGKAGISGGQSALGGGGRYDGLVELLGGRPTPACGFAVGIERTVSALKGRQIKPEGSKHRDVFLAQLGDVARRKGLALFEAFRAEGIPVAEAFGKSALKAQLELADKYQTKYTLILGQKEVLEGTIIVRDMESGVQETVDMNKVIGIIKKKLTE
ncbi:MAG: histidine--tRNA ligase [Patescibacteria group bacterium]